MRWIKAGVFKMGSDRFYEEERPVRDEAIGSFRIDVTPVTNDEFARFVAATDYVTLAETAPDADQYPGMLPELAVPGSIVFTPSVAPMDLSVAADWWRFVPGADWRHPTGPESDIAALGRHPVIHIAYQDALAYAAWAGKSLPTEAEWEYAARGGLAGRDYAWGDELYPAGRRMAKTWDGIFPWYNAASAGLERTSPVGRFPPNGFGLYDMIGNVWEWTCETYRKPASPESASPGCCGGRENSGQAAMPVKVLKGGSHLCAPDYCQRYRPAARWPQPIDTASSHVGFRCVLRSA